MSVRMSSARRAAASVLVSIPLAVGGLLLGPLSPVATPAPVPVASQEIHIAVTGEQAVALPFAASHVALHWPGNPGAVVTVALSPDGRTYGPPTTVEPDEMGDRAGSTETYSGVIVADGARYVRVTTDRSMPTLAIVAMDSHENQTLQAGSGSVANAAVSQPSIISRAAWGADESLRFDSQGLDRWPEVFEPIQKFVIHHTATANNDPNPAATVRAILRLDAITKGWGDIGYNFLIDAQGRIYEGRYSRPYAKGEIPTGEDLAGNLVTGGHVLGFNSGVVGIAMLGTYSSVDVTPAARAALERLLAWETERHGIDPLGSARYVNPVSGVAKTFPNIAGHRDLAATACPGSRFYATLPTIRKDVAARVAAATGAAVDHVAPTVLSAAPITLTPTVSHSISFGLVFSEPVTDLAADDIATAGTSTGWTVASVTGSAAIYRVVLTADAPTVGTVGLTIAAGGATDLGGNAGPVANVDSPTVSFVASLAGTVTRISGRTRYDTAAAVSAATFAPGVPVAFVTTGVNFPDALAGSVAAAIGQGPILLVPGGTIPSSVAAELTRLTPGRIVVLGGTSVVSTGLQTALAKYTAGTVTRISGRTRYDTAAAVSAATFAPGVPVAFVTTGVNFPDALAGSVAAAIGQGPILLVPGGTIPSSVAAELTRLTPGRIVVLGGTSVVSTGLQTALAKYTAGTVTRISGRTRYDTAAAVSAATFAPGVPVAFVTTGVNFPDALAGSVAAAIGQGPILLVPGGTIPSSVAAELTRLTPGRIVVLGGTSVVSTGLQTALAKYVPAP